MMPVGPPAPGIRVLELDDEISLYEPDGRRVLLLNGAAGDVWRLCDGTLTLPELVAVLARAYAVDAEAIRPDVERTVAELTEAGFLP